MKQDHSQSPISEQGAEDFRELPRLKPTEVFEHFDTSLKGLSDRQATERLEKFGKNKLHKERNFHPLKQLLKQFTHFMAIMLWIAGILALVAKMPELAIATWAVIIINALFSFFQEFKADKALSELAGMIPSRVKVFRDGELTVISAEDITIGDVIALEAGDSVPADARLVKTDGLFLNNSMLTGESLPVDRHEEEFDIEDKPLTESTNFVFAGTTVTQGKGIAVVYAIANDTEIGKVSRLTQTIEEGASTLEIQIQKIVKVITIIAITMGVAAFALSIVVTGLDWQYGFVFAIGIIVANVPEGLLPTVSLCLAVGTQRMAKEKALVRKQSAIETLSAATVICTDKTGTLTQNQLMLTKIWTPDNSAEVGGAGYKKTGKFDILNKSNTRSIDMLLTTALICSDTSIKENEADRSEWRVIGSPTEAALLIAAGKYGMDIDKVRNSYVRLNTFAFSSERKMMSVIANNHEDDTFEKGEKYVFTKGAPNIVINSCKYLFRNGEIIELDEAGKAEILQVNDKMASEGYRVLGICYEEAVESSQANDENLIFLGLTAMYDPPRPEVYDAIKHCHEAGLKVTVITGDYGLTAAAIGKQIGLIEDKHQIVTGAEVQKMSQKELMEIVKQDIPLIFSRTTPEHKLKIVEAYKKLGDIVAVTGDGVNDILALKSSHIGIAMGKNGTDVARESADMILLDDNFATIVKAIEEGRSIYSNIRKFITYILASNIPEILPFIAMVIFKIPPALTVLQILAIDLGTDLLPALALGAEKPEKGVLKQPPRKASENLLNGRLFARAYGYIGMIEGLLSMAAFAFVWPKFGVDFPTLQSITESAVAGTAGFLQPAYIYATTFTLLSVIACQIGDVFVCRSDIRPMWESLKSKNNLIYYGIAVEILLAVAITLLPFMQKIFATMPVAINDILLLAVCPVMLIILEEGRKGIVRARMKRKQPHKITA